MTALKETSPAKEPASREVPPEAWRPIVNLVRSTKSRVDRFFKIEAAGGVVLLIAAGLALIWANSPWAETYAAFWHTPLALRIGAATFEGSFEWLVNDVLMTVFFFVVGMEIRRELHDGELSQWRRAALPAVAALGGMIAPAAVYSLFTVEARSHSGWGIPMATDIAFAVGVLALLGKRVPPALRVLLLALAVIDDLGAILVIACFYSPGVAMSGLLLAGLGVSLILGLRVMGVRRSLAYIVPAAVVWVGVQQGGIHPTIAGVIVGLLTPVRAWYGHEGFVKVVRAQAQRAFEAMSLARASSANYDVHESMARVAVARREAVSPAEFLIEALHPWVAFLIMPLFALANAGVSLHGVVLAGATADVSVAVAAALLLGKPLGIIAVSLTAIGIRLAALPEALGPIHLALLGTVAGVGFTMSLFIAQLAFADPSLLAAAKLGVLAGSSAAMLVALLIGRSLLPLADDGRAREPTAPQSLPG